MQPTLLQMSRPVVALGLAIATLLGSPGLAGAQSTTTVSTSIPDHFYEDLVDYGAQLPPPPATAEQATITVPLEAPTATATYAWIMNAVGTQAWTQVGIAWYAGQQPYIFADSDQSYEIGPAVNPGSSITVRLEKQGSSWVDEYLTGGGWVVLQRSVVNGELTRPTVESYFAGSASTGTWLFREVGYEMGSAYFSGAPVWHHMAGVGIGN